MQLILIRQITVLLTASIICSLSLSCVHNHQVSKGSVAQYIGRDIHPGATKSEVLKYLDTLEINGIKAERGDYAKGGYTIPSSKGEAVEVDGTVGAMFREKGIFHDFCSSIGVIFYFDKSEKLITYVVDCFG
jgi:hypothetical protein